MLTFQSLSIIIRRVRDIRDGRVELNQRYELEPGPYSVRGWPF